MKVCENLGNAQKPEVGLRDVQLERQSVDVSLFRLSGCGCWVELKSKCMFNKMLPYHKFSAKK